VRLKPIPVWGVGAWAIEGYKREIGGNRLFLNVPYFSDLSPYFAIERKHNPRSAVTKFLFSGSLINRKGVDLLAEAFLALITSGAEAELTFIGTGPLEKALRDATRPVSARVSFCGFKQWHELPKIYAAHDVLCAPSRYDGWGLVVPEGLAAGMPVIATEAMGSARDMLTSKSGWVVRGGDASPLFEAMRAAVRQSPAQRRAMIERGREAARQHHIEAGVRRVWEAISQTLAACRA
jgi:glycosyltransferase involved in cell wall biosynthesis